MTKITAIPMLIEVSTLFESPKNEQRARKRMSRMLLTSRELTRIMKTFMSFVIMA